MGNMSSQCMSQVKGSCLENYKHGEHGDTEFLVSEVKTDMFTITLHKRCKE